MLAGLGPTHTSPASITVLREVGILAERKPYPGWIASAPVAFAAAMILSPTR